MIQKSNKTQIFIFTRNCLMSKKYFTNLNIQKLTELKEVKLEGLKKINLNLTQDAQTIVNELNAVMDELEEVTRSLENSSSEYAELERQTNTFISTATELLKQANNLQDEGNNVYRELESGAEALGLDVGDIPIAMELDEVTVNIDDVTQPTEDAIDDVKSYMP